MSTGCMYSHHNSLRITEPFRDQRERCFSVNLNVCLPMLLFQILVVFLSAPASFFFKVFFDSPIGLFIVNA